MSRGKRPQASQATAGYDPLLEQASDLGVMLAAEAELKRQLDAVKARLRPAAKDYDAAWWDELVRRVAERGVSWCTCCGEVTPLADLADAFSTYWKTEGYDAEPTFRDLELHRACRPCLEKKSQPYPLGQLDSYLAKCGRKPYFTYDHRDYYAKIPARPVRQETVEELGEVLGLPPHRRQLEKLGTRADVAVAIEAAVAPAVGSRSRPSGLADRG